MKLEHRQHMIELEKGKNEIMTTEGIIRGVKDGEVHVYRGIRYGVARRFHEPERAASFDGVREAISYGPACPEYSTEIPVAVAASHPFYTIQSEDCLYLNVWTRYASGCGHASVVVFFADKNFSVSKDVASMEMACKQILAISNAVVITVYTRLNVLGYLDLSRFGDEYINSGNLGLLDRTLALEWIRENAAAFGGNPNDIQIRLSPYADPKLTIERTTEEAAIMTDALLERLGANGISHLLNCPYEELIQAALYAESKVSSIAGRHVVFSPVKNPTLFPGHPVIHTPDGMLRGSMEDATYVFRGIKYADAARFHMPEAVKAWAGIRDALVYGPVCPEIETVNPDDNFTVPHVFYPQDEDCQYLNVWTQNPSPSHRKPVMVWLHGGGFATGSGIEHFAYNGKAMSEAEDVVVVTLNHRLNVLGYLDLSDYGEEYRYTGNLGTADIIEALRWIQRNIACFGGDPFNVTVFGQSGGGGKVAALLQTPSADGLFHKAVIQSGIVRFHKNKDTGEKMAAKVLAYLDLRPEQVRKIEDIPYYQLARAVKAVDPRAGFAFGPTTDNDFYLGDILETGICEHAKHIPVLIGNVLGEFSQNFVFTEEDGQALSAEASDEGLKKYFGADAALVADLQNKAYPGYPVANVLYTDARFRPGTFEYLHLRAQTGIPNTYGFMFCLKMPVYGGTLPWHNAEIPYVFHNADCIAPSYISGITERIQAFTCHAWCSFGRDGNPGWDCYDEKKRTMMYIDRVCCTRDSAAEEELIQYLKDHPVTLTRITREQSPVGFGGGPRR